MTPPRRFSSRKQRITSPVARCFFGAFNVQCTLIRLPDKGPKSSDEEFRKVGKEARSLIPPAFLPSSLILYQETE
jgi:hypothetical protein